jgi:hypothetical protein
MPDRGSLPAVCQNATFDLTAPITFTAPDQQIYTEGLPTWSSRATTRGWSTLHIIEGTVTNNVPTCQTATIQDNTISDAGTDTSGHWADGISLSCGDSKVEYNTVTNATDGGIVVFGAPGRRFRTTRSRG